jgi:phosphoglycolate phosphatase-like HAD superfamily hydrolase
VTRFILFDFDGVFADTLDDMLRFSREVCASLGHPRTPTRHDLDALDSMDIRSYARQLGLPEDTHDDFAASMVECFRQKTEPPKLFDQVGEVIAQLARGNRLGIVTGNSTEMVWAFLAHHGLDGYISGVMGADVPGTRAEKIRLMMRELGAPPEATFMVGDSISDVRAAQEVGVTSIAVAWGHQSAERIATATPDVIVYSPEELLRVVGEDKSQG